MGRQTCMRTLGTAAALVTLLALAGCGESPQADQTSPADATAQPPSPSAWGTCTDTALESVTGVSGELTTVDGRTAAVTLTAPGTGPCTGAIIARGPQDLSGTDVSGLGLDLSTARLVDLVGPGGGTGQLLVVHSTAHPRGGFQPHLFVLTDGGPAEVLLDGRPLLPFVATDGGAAPMTATCDEDGGVAVLSASTSKPPGVVLAWDIQLTTYDVSRGDAVETSSRQVEDHAADPVLRDERPELFDPGALFADCSGPWGD